MVLTQVFNSLFTVSTMSIGLAHVAYSAIARDSDVDPPTMHNDGQLMPSSSSTSGGKIMVLGKYTSNSLVRSKGNWWQLRQL
ncbi:hypothetical protein E3P96_01108 [Wallemia ichthyophaga]|nr:hypothetical protein E3P96_01108 [Wallemia ichthyophaga]